MFSSSSLGPVEMHSEGNKGRAGLFTPRTSRGAPASGEYVHRIGLGGSLPQSPRSPYFRGRLAAC